MIGPVEENSEPASPAVSLLTQTQALPKEGLKERQVLLLGGMSCVCAGSTWAWHYALQRRLDLVIIFLALAMVGVAALVLRRRYGARRIAFLAHAMLLLVVAISSAEWYGTSSSAAAYLHFLPLAAGSAFVFGTSGRYLANVLPVICIFLFVLFGSINAIHDFDHPAVFLSDAAISTFLNHLIAAVLLAGVLYTYRRSLTSKLSSVRALVEGIARKEIILLYQVQVDTFGKPVGAEALARWRHPVHGLLGPDHFIPLAEQTGVIVELGLSVLTQACEQLRAWALDERTRAMTIAVNISALQVRDPGFPDEVRRIIETTGVDPTRLELELTESALSSDPDLVRDIMRQVREYGVRWALDDFGTGFSSLSLLRSLPVQKIKIDRQFVRDAQSHPHGRILLGKIIEIAQVLNMDVIAEGVELESQQDMLIELGCNHFQGYLHGRPEPADALAARAG